MGHSYDHSNSVLVADIRRFFNDSTDPASAVDTGALLKPTLLRANFNCVFQVVKRSLGRNVPLGYDERGVTQTGLSISTDQTDELQGVFRGISAVFHPVQATITGISGDILHRSRRCCFSKVRITTLKIIS